jgi:hypothetical protein
MNVVAEATTHKVSLAEVESLSVTRIQNLRSPKERDDMSHNVLHRLL